MLFDTPKPPEPKAANAVMAARCDKQKARLAKVRDALETAWPDLEHGMAYHFASATMWSTHDLILRFCDMCGPLNMAGATWSMTAEPCQLILQALTSSRLASLSMLFDWRVKVRCPQALALCRMAGVDLRVSTCHAKVYCLHNDTWKITIVGSSNLTNNPRIEAGTVFTTPEAWEFHYGWISQEIANAKPFGENIGGYGNRDNH